MKIFKLKNISKFVRNGVTIKQDISSKEGIPITRIETISKGIVDFDKLGYANIFELEKYEDWLLQKGDILISHINSEKHLGKSAIFLNNDMNIIHGMNLLCVRVIDNIVFPEYLQLFFKTNQYKKQIKKIMKKSVNQASFSVNDFKEILITLPELDIQEKIIKKIMTLEKILENNKLKLKFLSELNKSLFNSQIQPYIKELEIKKLGDIIEVKSSKRVFLNELSKNGVPFYRGTEIAKLSRNENVESNLFISEDLYQNLKKISDVPKIGDLLLPSICNNGEIWYVNKTNPFYFKDGRVLWLKLNKNINGKYLQYYLIEKFRQDYSKIASGTTFSELKIVTLKNLLLPVPPIELQKKFAERVEKIEKLSFNLY